MLKATYTVKKNQNGIKVLGAPFWAETEVNNVKRQSLCEVALYSDEYKVGDRITLHYNSFTTEFETVKRSTLKVRFLTPTDRGSMAIVERPLYLEYLVEMEDMLYNIENLKHGSYGQYVETF